MHGVPLFPSSKTRVDGYPRKVWLSEAGEELIESYTIRNMAHGTPLGMDDNEAACGAPGPFFLPVGISSSYHIAKFFGIVPPASASKEVKASRLPAEPVLQEEIVTEDRPPRRHDAPRHAPDIGAVISKALRAAGLMKH